MLYKQDFIERIIEQGVIVLRTLCGMDNPKNEEVEDIQIQLKDLYKNYFNKHYTFFYNENIETIINSIKEEHNSKDSLKLFELLADFLFTDAKHQNDKFLQKQLTAKAYDLLNYIENNSDTYSINRNNKVTELREYLLYLN
jgi:hypothetical protein